MNVSCSTRKVLFLPAFLLRFASFFLNNISLESSEGRSGRDITEGSETTETDKYQQPLTFRASLASNLIKI